MLGIAGFVGVKMKGILKMVPVRIKAKGTSSDSYQQSRKIQEVSSLPPLGVMSVSRSTLN